MYDIDNGNPLKRFFARPQEEEQVPDDAVLTDGKVVPIKPPRQRLSPLRRFSVAQLLLVPVLASAMYFYVLARDRYVTRSDFVIRKAEDAANAEASSLGSLLGRSNQLSLEDARFLKTYLQSPQVLNDLSRTYDLDRAYARDRRDPFAGIKPSQSPEKRLSFFKKQVAVTLDELSGAIVLRTVGLNPKSSYDLNRFMLAKSEQFVNRLNQDISLKQLLFAEAELQRARINLDRAKNRLINYQNANSVVIDIKGEAELASVTISKLQERLVDRKVELATLRRQYKDPREPEVLAIADEARELEQQIAKERRALVSSKGRNLNRKAADVVKLESDVNFATDTYKLALTSVEKARVESKRQQKFMALLSAPQMPEDPQGGWRTKGFFTILASCAVLFSLTKFVLGMQASHRQ
jgi:capsular polysaccharide transport system permease protein